MKKRKIKTVKDCSGQKSGKLTVTKFSHNCNGQNYWECVCDCGNIRTIKAKEIGKVKSCGCYRGKGPKLTMRGCNHHSWNGCGELSGNKFKQIKRDAIRRNLSFEITIEYIWDLFLKQDKKCIYTGLDIEFGNEYFRTNTTASLDRINSSEGYIEGNLQWVHKDINLIKMNLPENRFINLCKLVYDKSCNKIYEG